MFYAIGIYKVLSFDLFWFWFGSSSLFFCLWMVERWGIFRLFDLISRLVLVHRIGISAKLSTLVLVHLNSSLFMLIIIRVYVSLLPILCQC